MRPEQMFERLHARAEKLARTEAVITGEAAAHLHIAVATRSPWRGPLAYSAKSPSQITAIFPRGESIEGITSDASAVAEVARHRLDMNSAAVELAGGPPLQLRVLSREATLAQLLERGGLAIGLAGQLLQATRSVPIDLDDVRDLLKAARLGERFQPVLELIDAI